MYVHTIEGAGTLVVNRHGTSPEGRATYGWYVYDANGDMLGGAADLSSGVGMEPTEREMVATLASFLDLLLAGIQRQAHDNDREASVRFLRGDDAEVSDGWLRRPDGWFSRTRENQAASNGPRSGW